MDDELSRQQRNSEKQLASEQYSLRYVKTEENTFATSIGTARIATKAHKTAHSENKAEGAASSPNRTGKGTTQRYSGIGQFVNYQTCTGLRQHGSRLLLVTEPETEDPGHRSMLCKDSDPRDSEVKDAYSISFNQGRNIENNDSCSMGKHEFL